MSAIKPLSAERLFAFQESAPFIFNYSSKSFIIMIGIFGFYTSTRTLSASLSGSP